MVAACIALAGAFAAATSTTSAACGTPPDGGLTHGRLGLWRSAAETVPEHPLAGAGAGAFLVATRAAQGDAPVAYAHDLPLEVAVELGTVGVLALGILLAGVGRALRRARGTPALWLFGPAVVAVLAANLVDWSWRLAGVGAVFAVALGGLIAAGER